MSCSSFDVASFIFTFLQICSYIFLSSLISTRSSVFVITTSFYAASIHLTGFPKTLSCSLFNTSCVSMTICLRVLGDGLGPPSVSYDKQLSDMSRNDWQASAARGCHARPMELTISPASGSVPPMAEFPIEV